ncbi:UDP-N-acetylmuramoyl-L-alanine--D-glutamate ligase [Altererythrobacter salegens]|uniref:UDP-N-acetylmuramoylalanine--D-glutamate ligase n=1 Tax=Croceibacterium salegens TaxID=1737568 RepID=A0A6I4SQX5_9SPHN|nr:UDP-N-acetylmuramoyl-L-alanine--D-glutamate ligase [Croceibacterium salegens]MXO58029.1 UDP-N-acetylmuramoyl-L-alanine--D-glutamate ligase [Croceibacterium salegens]
MIESSAFAGKRFAVLGLARSGLATVASLHASGAQVTAWDRRPGPREEVSGMAAIGDPLEIDLAGFDGIVVSPGVPLNTHPLTARARAAGVPLIGDIELFAMARTSLPAHKVVGITGTNGKSTTTALVHHLFESAGVAARMGGNIGLPILAQEPLPEGGVYVLELSSYQIDLTHSLECDAAALTNVTPDHLDRYDGFDAYAASKARLFAMQRADQFAVFGCEDNATRAIYQTELARRDAGRVARADTATLAARQRGWIGLKGPHNLQNAAIARQIALELGLGEEQIEAGLAGFRGLPHRMEILGTFGGVTFINDSKATNPASTAPALGAYPRNAKPHIHWIVGGLPKGDNLDDCAPGFPNVAAAYTIGEAGPHFADLLEPQMPVQRCEMLCEAVTRALAVAKEDDVIMLSPACASFDQFKDYEARGEAFRQIVEGLTGGTSVPFDFAGRSAA